MDLIETMNQLKLYVDNVKTKEQEMDIDNKEQTELTIIIKNNIIQLK